MSTTWIFGYGSLIWRPDFPALECRPGFIRGWSRRFWQMSPDHRGTCEAPGRVVTLVEDASSTCWGMAYQVCNSVADEVLAGLDHREKAGYERVDTPLHTRCGQTLESVIVYIAGPENQNFTGERSIEEIAAVAAVAEGPSGPNCEYVLRLAEALEEMGAVDEHVQSLAARVRALIA